jgi:hypothetical protein
MAIHCVLSSAELRALAEKEGLASSLPAPADGDALVI